MTPPHIIAIAGASCSGKTTIARELARALGSDDTTVLGVDSYYYDLSHLPPQEVHTQNLDEPSALEHTLLIEHVATLARGEAIEKPVYDHKNHSRATETEHIEPKSFLIIEGLFALYWEELRHHTPTKVFISAAHELCLARRIARDRSQRGRSREEVMHRYHTMVAPMFDRHVLPTHEYADLIIEGAGSIDESLGIVLRHIAAAAGGGSNGGVNPGAAGGASKGDTPPGSANEETGGGTPGTK